MENISIRFLCRDDCKELFRLSQELAALGQNVSKVSPEVLEHDCFDADPPRFRCFVAEENATLCGYALFYPIYSTREGRAMWLEDIFVSPSCRIKGVGRALFTAVVQEAQTGGYCRVDFSVYSWNPAAGFYSKMGAVNISETEKWTLWRLDQDGISDLINQEGAIPGKFSV